MATIAIISQKGGAGKTTLAIHLAAAAERAGVVSLIIDTDPQATARRWGKWRKGKPPEVIDSGPARIAAKVEAAQVQGAGLIVIDTPPHADSAATRAIEVADLVLVPCRPSAFDLDAIRTTIRLARLVGKGANVVFTAGPPNAPRVYDDARSLVSGFGGQCCPVLVPDRAIYRRASAAGGTVFDFEPSGKAAREIEQLHLWACERLNMFTRPQVKECA